MRKVFLIFTGIYLIVLGLIITICAGVTFLMQFSGKLEAQMANAWIVPVMNVPVIIWLIATGIGLLLHKSWARYSILVMSGLAILVGIVMCLAFIVMPNPTAVDASFLVIKTIMIGLGTLFIIVLPIVYLIFFTRKSVIELIGGSPDGSSAERPVGISILSILAAFGGVMVLINLFFSSQKEVPFLGNLFLSGLPLQMYFVILGLVDIYCAYGLWKLKKSAWCLYVGLCIFGLVSTVINLVSMNRLTLVRMGVDQTAYFPLFMFRGVMGVSILFVIWCLYYLMKQRDWFFKNRVNEAIEPDGVVEDENGN